MRGILQCLLAFVLFMTAVGLSQTAKPMTEWYYADGSIHPDGIDPRQGSPAIWSPGRDWIVIFNLYDKEQEATATFYFEDIAPREHHVVLPPRADVRIEVHEIPAVVPTNKQYGVRITAPMPIVVQSSRAEYEHYNPVSRAMTSRVLYPGPLGQKETRWIYPDSLDLSSGSALEEREWISVMNPGSRDAHINITFNFGGKQELYALTVPSERVRSLDLFNLALVPKNVISAPVIQSDVPIVVEQVRRAYVRGVPVIFSLWATLAYPIGDTDLH